MTTKPLPNIIKIHPFYRFLVELRTAAGDVTTLDRTDLDVAVSLIHKLFDNTQDFEGYDGHNEAHMQNDVSPADQSKTILAALVLLNIQILPIAMRSAPERSSIEQLLHECMLREIGVRQLAYMRNGLSYSLDDDQDTSEPETDEGIWGQVQEACAGLANMCRDERGSDLSVDSSEDVAHEPLDVGSDEYELSGADEYVSRKKGKHRKSRKRVHEGRDIKRVNYSAETQQMLKSWLNEHVRLANTAQEPVPLARGEGGNVESHRAKHTPDQQLAY
jgi:hypothetical protein